MATPNSGNSRILPNDSSKTVSLTFHLYPRHYQQFLTICERLDRFHSDILRELVIDFITRNKSAEERKQILKKLPETDRQELEDLGVSAK